jgi:[acyl-carrier-protein] S-malonyltransferase
MQRPPATVAIVHVVCPGSPTLDDAEPGHLTRPATHLTDRRALVARLMYTARRGRMLVLVTPILMFPGQSSRDAAMIERALSLEPEANTQLVREASDVLGRDLLAHYRADNPAIFATNRDIQVGVFLANHLHLQSLEHAGVRVQRSLGMSLGEYNHLVHIGALDFADALRLVDARGVAYDAGPDGMMAAIFPIPLPELESIVRRANEHGIVQIGNYNSPTQHVLSGERPAVEAALRMLDDEHLVEAAVIDERIPMHSRRFWPVVRTFLPALQKVPWQPIRQAYLPNVMGRHLSSPTPGDLIYLLTQHIWRPVRWRQSIDFLAQRYPDAVFVEVGPRTVLTGLLQRRWHPNPRLHTDARPDSDPRVGFEAAVRGTAGYMADTYTFASAA